MRFGVHCGYDEGFLNMKAKKGKKDERYEDVSNLRSKVDGSFCWACLGKLHSDCNLQTYIMGVQECLICSVLQIMVRLMRGGRDISLASTHTGLEKTWKNMVFLLLLKLRSIKGKGKANMCSSSVRTK